jgi:hypothetical protein
MKNATLLINTFEKNMLIAIYLYISINLQEDEKGMEFLMVVTKSK